jgi:hypothetical protein
VVRQAAPERAQQRADKQPDDFEARVDAKAREMPWLPVSRRRMLAVREVRREMARGG